MPVKDGFEFLRELRRQPGCVDNKGSVGMNDLVGKLKRLTSVSA